MTKTKSTKKFTAIVLCAAMLFSVSTINGLALNPVEEATQEYFQSDTLLSKIRLFFYAVMHMDTIKQTQFTGAVGGETWDASDAYDTADTAVLEKQPGEDFVILNLTDIHISDFDYRAVTGFMACQTIKRLVKAADPDLITVTGDIVCADSTYLAVRRFTNLMESFGIPWAPVFGNHDGEGNCDLNYLADAMLAGEHCLLKKGPAEMGVGNYIVNIAENGHVVHSLIFMDTHRTHVNQTQIEWYKWAAKGICEYEGTDVESSVFFHIPVVQYQLAYDAAFDAQTGAWRDGYEAWGEKNETVCCDRDGDELHDNGFFNAVLECGTTKNIFCGHDHMNNFSVLWQGVRLTYTLKVGLGSGYQQGFDGGTVIRIGGEEVGIRHLYASELELF